MRGEEGDEKEKSCGAWEGVGGVEKLEWAW